MLAVAGNTDGSDVLIAVMVMIPATIGALAGLVAASQARKAKQHAERASDEVRSPNGTRTGDAVYQVAKRVEAIEGSQTLMALRQDEVARDVTALTSEFLRHAADDALHFAEAKEQIDVVIANQMEIKQRGELMTEQVAQQLAELRGQQPDE